MERYREEELIEEKVESVVHARRSYVKYNAKRDLPMMLAVRNAGFTSHGQLFSQLLAEGTEINRQGFCWRVKRLIGIGVIDVLPQQFPFSGAIYTITRQGLACLESCGQGLVCLTSESRSLLNPRQAPHYLKLGEIRQSLREAGVLGSWVGDLELSSINQSIELPLAKDYDAVANIDLDGSSFRVALEYERSLKSSARYREIVAALEEERQIRFLIYLAASIDMVYQLIAQFEGLKFPVAFAPSGAFCADPLGIRMHNTIFSGQKKSTLLELLRAAQSKQSSPFPHKRD